jgi:hypothetical protein
MSGAFKHEPGLLNHAFNAYKVSGGSCSGEERAERQVSYRLPGSVLSTSLASDGQIIGHRVVKDRASARYLVKGFRADHAAYIDDNRFVVLIVVNRDAEPTFSPIYRMPEGSSAMDELPGLVALDEDRWLCSHGDGLVSLIKVAKQGERWSGSVEQSWSRHFDGQAERIPFRVIGARSDASIDGNIKVVLQRTLKGVVNKTVDRQGLGCRESSSMASQKVEGTSKTTFELTVSSLLIKEEDVRVLSTYGIDEAPYLVNLRQDGAAVIISETEACETSDTSNNMSPPAAKKQKHQQHPYSWTQTKETVTIAMRLPERIRKQDIGCDFESVALHLTLDASPTPASIHEITVEDDNVDDLFTGIQSGKYANQTWWAEIDAGSSLWTLERSTPTASRHCVLTMHLEKKHAGTRWTSVFQSSEDEVPETVDPSELSTMLDGLRKYTEDQEIGQQNNSLLQDGLEEEDANVGRACVVSIIDEKGGLRILDRSATLLATPIDHTLSGMAVRRDLDGLIFDLHAEPFRHVDTLPALSYVLASKQNLQRTYVHRVDGQPSTILAIDSSASNAGEPGNLFVYHSPLNVETQQIASNGRSSVIRLTSDHTLGAFVDATVLTTSSGERLLVLLCHDRLVVIHDVL